MIEKFIYEYYNKYIDVRSGAMYEIASLRTYREREDHAITVMKMHMDKANSMFAWK